MPKRVDTPSLDSATVLCLMGPTAVGKTQLAMRIVDQFPCDIVSVDSALVYRHMDIGTAKPSEHELQQYPHRLINLCDPSEAYSTGRFLVDVHREIKHIQQQQRIPLLVGGTMLYFHALQQGLATLPTSSASVRQQITQAAQQQGWSALHKELQRIDPLAAQGIHPNDPQRLQRALEVYYLTGRPISTWWQAATESYPSYHFYNLIILPEDRAQLHQNIAHRFDNMLAQGFLAEVETLFKRDDLTADLPAMRTVGYRQAWAYLKGELRADEMRERAIIATRQLAKRQMTWLRRWQQGEYIASMGEQAQEEALNLLMKRLII